MWHSARASTGSDRSRLQPPLLVSVARSAQIRLSASKPTSQVGQERVPLAGHRDVLGAVEPQADRPAGERRAQRGDRGQAVRLELLAAEPAAHPQALHGDLVAVQAQHVRDDLLGLATGAGCWTGRRSGRSRRPAPARRWSPGRSAPGRRTRTRR